MQYPHYVAGRAVTSKNQLQVTDKFTGETFATVSIASAADIDHAIAAAVKAAEPLRKLASFERQAVLYRCLEQFQKRSAELADIVCKEAGKPIRDSRSEVTRLIDTFRIAAEESVRIVGEVLPLDISARVKGYTGMWKRVPIGPCSFIAPFNFPLNLVAHKIAPAIAVGCPFILKPASRTPVSALVLGEILAAAGLPEGAFSILPCQRDGADLFTTDERLKLLSFTGSPAVGWDLKARAGKKKVVLELGGNAAAIVEEDADVDNAVDRVVFGAFYGSGQSCISVQRILVHETIYESFRERLIAETLKLKAGDPKAEETFIGPLIDESEAVRLEKWIGAAVARGAKILCGGGRKGAVLEPTLLEAVPADEPLCAAEAFGPVAILSSYKTFSEAIRLANDSTFGLQAGVFTRDIYKAQRAWDELEVGGVIINDVPSWRVDHMPYGGVKDSGLGREGVRFAMEDMTEIRMLVLRPQ